MDKFEYRYYGKREIREECKIDEENLRWIGDNEVFETTSVSKIFADLLHGKCRIWDVEDYDGRKGMGPKDFYTRAKYNIKTVRIQL